ncbi:AI-2E family transporter [Paenisporosarcina antarctica]|uniref:AI-2E family transporter n=1 Tax=Paenisporosarcina antarctica TaxID=417367 RepID=A0A4P7A089_9BACL|nr:AI-2E family transporter [Paenisporosarcina antarctica]QBP41246.1 AI-2E family transporter [Paenisporosarcina antarctica]
MLTTKWFRFLYSAVLILIVINLALLVPFIFNPIQVIFSTLAPIIIIGGILYYIFRPLVHVLSRKMHRVLAILLIFLSFIGLITGFSIWLGPLLVSQVTNLVNNFPAIVHQVQNWIDEALSSQWWSYIEDQEYLSDFDSASIADNFSLALSGAGASVLGIMKTFFSAMTSLVVVPFVLFFLLKDGDKLPDSFLSFLPHDSRDEGRNILQDMDENLSAYIQGQAIVSLFVGVLSFIAYLIIGVDYAIILALIAMLTNVIPFVGPLIGASPAVIVAFFQDPLTALWVIIAIIIIQQVESNLISPNVMGRKLSVHPVTIIFLLYIGGNLAGLVGMILVIPVYAVGKAIAENLYRLIKLRFPEMR